MALAGLAILAIVAVGSGAYFVLRGEAMPVSEAARFVPRGAALYLEGAPVRTLLERIEAFGREIDE